ncbi:translation elongation factor Ts [Pendulispora albinea]|uniref:Elongation factor Ts n=1 Tax=Pendulispora albinea TaxID=2741071 RepID=A0ABZ2LK55_9BACT
MPEITVGLVKELRERTQAGMSDCKSALVEAEGDIEKAIEIIQKKGLLKGQARAGKVATEGEVRTWVEGDGSRGLIVEVNCQTDFVARGDDFRGFVTKVVDLAKTTKRPASPTEGAAALLTQSVPGSSDTLDTVRLALVGKTGENTVVRRWDVLTAAGPNDLVIAYVHMGGKLAVLLRAEAPSVEARNSAAFKEFVENVAMQVAAMSPLVVRKEEVSEAVVAKQKEIYEAQLREEPKPKPEASWPKIIEGKVAKWFTEVTLLGQDNVWAPEKGTIDAVRQEIGKSLGGEVKLHEFVRFGLGEGIEKKSDDLAAEVAKMTAG